MSITQRVRARRARGDRGAVLVEAAFAFPLLIVLTFGIFEFGLAWRDRITVQTATRAGARTGASLGNDPLTDYNILQAIKSGMSSVPQANINLIVIYNASAAGGDPTPGCAGGTSQAGVCNVYIASDLNLGSGSFGCGGGKDTPWCPTSRIVDQANVNGLDYLGVYISVKHDYITQLFGVTGPVIKDKFTVRLEPQ